MPWYWYPIIGLAIYGAGIITGALAWRKNPDLEARGKKALLDLSGKGK